MPSKKSTVISGKKSTKKATRSRASISKEIEAKQEAFLVAYGQVGTIRKACQLTEVGRSTVGDWEKKNVCNFKIKMTTAKEMFRELLQDTAWEKVKAQKPGDNPVLHITLLNAHWPEKYKRDANSVTSEVKEMMSEWRQWKRKEGKEGKKKVKVEVSEAEEARQNAIDQVENLLAKKQVSGDGTSD
jgi:hypothetical protein